MNRRVALRAAKQIKTKNLRNLVNFRKTSNFIFIVYYLLLSNSSEKSAILYIESPILLDFVNQ